MRGDGLMSIRAVVAALTAAGVPSGGGDVDPLWDYVRALLHFDGENNSTDFVDEVSGNTWTVGGGAKISTAQSLFGGASGDFSANSSGGSDYISLPDSSILRPGLSEYAIEFDLFYINQVSEWFAPFQKGVWNAGAGNLTIIFNASVFRVIAAGVSGPDVPHGLVVNAHNRIAVTRDASNVCRAFINGVKKMEFTQDQNINGTYPIEIMRGGGGGGVGGGRGYFDEFRYTVGASRRTAAYTPDEAPFPDTGPA